MPFKDMTVQYIYSTRVLQIGSCVCADFVDIVDGKQKVLLALMWTLIVHYSIERPSWRWATRKQLEHFSPREQLLQCATLPFSPIASAIAIAGRSGRVRQSNRAPLQQIRVAHSSASGSKPQESNV